MRMPVFGRYLIFAFVAALLLPAVKAQATPPIPARIGGTVTIDGVQLTQATDAGYTFAVKKADGTAYEPAAEDTDGLNASNCYVINIPIYDEDEQPGGANPGDTAVVHVYKNGSELTVTSPINGQFTVSETGSVTQINLTATAMPGNVVYVDPNGCNGNTPCYSGIQQAIDAVNVSTVVKVVAGTFNENPALAQSIQIIIHGGYDSAFTSDATGTTTIKAPSVTSGSITLQNLKVSP